MKTVIPDLTLRFDDDMIVLEKWVPNKPLTAIYWEGEKELFYVKRFLIENADKEEAIITEHPKSYLEAIFTDYRPQAELVYAKKRGQDRKENVTIDLEDFISIKGITAMGNQLTKDKVLEINVMEPLPYEVPEPRAPEDIEVVDEENVPSSIEETNPKKDTKSPQANDDKEAEGDGQITLF